jgi:hypothetical protein
LKDGSVVSVSTPDLKRWVYVVRHPPSPVPPGKK